MSILNIAPAKAFVVAGILTLAGIACGLIYVAASTPYTMILFLGPGQLCFLLGIALFIRGALSAYRQRVEGITHRKLRSGEVVYEQGQVPEHVFVIGSGEVEFVRKETGGGEMVLGRLGPDTHFGEMAILAGTPQPATARAVTDVELVAIHKAGFERLYGQLPALRSRIDAELHRKKAAIEGN
jgi:CRP-like cAMP-binding protein